LSVRIPYKTFPLSKPSRVYPDLKETWVPILNVAVVIGHATSKRFEAVVDTGSPVCLFHASIGMALGLKLTDGIHDNLGGVIGTSKADVYFHKIKLKVMSDIIPIVGGFSEQLSVAAILGRHGFFDNFTVTFDPCNNPPGLIIERVGRS